VTIQSGSATAAGAVAGVGAAAGGKSAAKAKPDPIISNPIEMGHETDDMTLPNSPRSGPTPGMFDSPKAGLTYANIAYRPAD
jgi:hypothetical protein